MTVVPPKVGDIIAFREDPEVGAEVLAVDPVPADRVKVAAFAFPGTPHWHLRVRLTTGSDAGQVGTLLLCADDFVVIGGAR